MQINRASQYCLVVFAFVNLFGLGSVAQLPGATESQLEQVMHAEEVNREDEDLLTSLAPYKKHPINLNKADLKDLQELKLLSDLQVQQFLIYKKWLGEIIDVYELQAIPTWTLELIRALMPYITIKSTIGWKESFKQRLKRGEHSLILQTSIPLKSNTDTNWIGSNQRILFRYRYQFRNLLQFGLLADKDAGESLFKAGKHKGFDFYSFHFYVGRLGLIRCLAIGDFIINLGQGLVHWQGMAFKKSASSITIKRESSILQPYRSAGEYFFHRGIALSVQRSRWESTLFFSSRKLSANMVFDSSGRFSHVSAISRTGYHRTRSELEDRNNWRQLTVGVGNKYHFASGNVGIQFVGFRFSTPIIKKDEPYNEYSVAGNSWFNGSIDYSYTLRNFHLFGEAALDKNFNKAFLQGALISVDSRVDLSILYRNISKAYQSWVGNVFTESSTVSNEQGIYLGFALSAGRGWKLEAYSDIYYFPWLRYRTDSPGAGKDFLFQVSYTPDKKTEITARFRSESKPMNSASLINGTYAVTDINRLNWRLQVNNQLNVAFLLRHRIEYILYGAEKQFDSGFLGYADVNYKPYMKSYQAAVRLQYFETDSYDSRVFAYENDVLFSSSIPAYFDAGFRYYINLNFDLGKSISFWLRWAQTIYRAANSTGPGAIMDSENSKTELKMQLRYLL